MPSTLPLLPGSKRYEEREWLRARDGEWWDDVLDRIACGVSPREIAKEYCVRYALLIRVLEEMPERKADFVRAQEIHADGMMFDTLGIADTVQMGETRKLKGDGTEEVTTGDMTAHRKMRIDQRNKLASVLYRAKYGEKVDVNVSSVGLDTLLARYEEAKRVKVDAVPAIEGESMRVPEVVDAEVVDGI